MVDPFLDSDSFDVVPWDDPVVRRTGYPHDHPYIETHWLPVLGPTATWMLRRLASQVAAHPAGLRLDAGLLATSLGVPRGGGRRGAFARGLQRCVMFGVVRREGGGEVPLLAVRTHLPPLSRRQQERLASVLTDGGVTVPSEGVPGPVS